MKPKAKPLSLLTLVLVTFSLLLAGCVSNKQKIQDSMKAQGIEPLTTAELRKILSDATMVSTSPIGEYRGYYSADGTIEVEVWWIRREPIDRGKWNVSDEGFFCEYFGGRVEEERCYSVYPKKTKDEFTMVQMSGPISEKSPDEIVQSKVTNGR